MNKKQHLLNTVNGVSVGKPMKEVTKEMLLKAGHTPMRPLRAIRLRCLDCCGHRPKEVEMCTAVDCPSWPFRMGTDPWTSAPKGKPLSAEEFEKQQATKRPRGRPRKIKPQ